MKTQYDKPASRLTMSCRFSLLGVLVAATMISSASAQTTNTWDNSNVTNTPPAALDWFTGGPNSLGLWTGATVPVSSNNTVIKFFQDTTTALLNTNAPSTQAVNLNNGGSAFELEALTLSGRASSTASANLTMNSSGDALNFSAATGTITLEAVNATRTITYNVANNIQLGTAGSAGALTFTGGGSSAFNFSGAISELLAGGGSVVKSGGAAVTLNGTSSFTGGVTINAGTLTLATSQGFSGGVVINGGVLSVNIAQAFTGGITFNGGSMRFGVTGGALLGGNVLTFATGTSIVEHTSTAVGSTTYSSAVIESGATATFKPVSSGGGGTHIFTSGVSGSGDLIFTGGSTAGNTKRLTLNNSSGFTGNVTHSTQNDGGAARQYLDFTALGDGGKLSYGGNGPLNITYTGTGQTFNTRQLEMISNTGIVLNSNGSGALVFNTALSNAHASSKTLTLGGTYTGDNAFNGLIDNGSGTIGIGINTSGGWTLGNTNNTYSGITTLTAGLLSVAKLANGGAGNTSSIGVSSSAAASLVISAGTLRYTGSGDSTDRSFTLSGAGSLDASGTGPINFTGTASPAYGTVNQTRTLTLTGTNTGDNTLCANLADNGVTTPQVGITKTGIGTWVLAGANTNTGATAVSGGGTLVLDYGATNDNKIAGVLTLGGGTLTMKGATGDHVEEVTSTSLSAGGSFLTRDGANTAKLRMNAITRAAGGTISFGSDTLADTDSNNFGTLGTNGILGGWATLGNDWAVSADTNSADTTITALASGSYNTTVSGAGSSTTNYRLEGDASLGGAFAAGSLKIVNTNNSQTLNLGNFNLTITSSGATALGGIMYAGGGGFDDLYTIGNGGGSGRIVSSGTSLELIFAVQTGTLTVSAYIGLNNSGGPVTKSGAGRLEISSANTFTGATRVNEGVLRLRNNTAAGQTGGGIVVQNGAALELDNNITIGAEALTITGSGISGGGALKNVSGANTYQGTITIGAGGARINNDDAGNALTLRGIVTALFVDVTFGGAGNITHNTTAISGAGGVIKDGAGTLTLNVANTYTGTTTVNDGKLVLGVAGALPAGRNVVLAGGTLDMGAAANVAGTLTLSANSTIALGAGTLSFTGGVGDWSTFTLDLTGTLGPTTLRVGQNRSGLSPEKVARITYQGTAVMITSAGYIVPRPTKYSLLIIQ